MHSAWCANTPYHPNLQLELNGVIVCVCRLHRPLNDRKLLPQENRQLLSTCKKATFTRLYDNMAAGVFYAAGMQTLFRGEDYTNIVLGSLKVAETYRASPQDYEGLVICVPMGGYSKGSESSLKAGRYIPITYTAEPVDCPISAIADLFIYKFGRGFVADTPLFDLLSLIRTGQRDRWTQLKMLAEREEGVNTSRLRCQAEYVLSQHPEIKKVVSLSAPRHGGIWISSSERVSTGIRLGIVRIRAYA